MVNMIARCKESVAQNAVVPEQKYAYASFRFAALDYVEASALKAEKHIYDGYTIHLAKTLITDKRDVYTLRRWLETTHFPICFQYPNCIPTKYLISTHWCQN